MVCFLIVILAQLKILAKTSSTMQITYMHHSNCEEVNTRIVHVFYT